MYERLDRTNRDVFDVWYFLQKDWPINKELVEKRIKMPFKDFLQNCIKKLEKLPERSILAGMGEFLTANQKNWARAKLRTETIFLLKARLESEK